jgi:hypothetical protein
VIAVGSLIGWQVSARSYSSLITVEDGDFASEVAEISFDQIPMLDKASANVLANRKLGECPISFPSSSLRDSYQINYNNKPVRVTYLYYATFSSGSTTRRQHPAYMVIDMVTQEVSVKRLEEGIRYRRRSTFSAIFPAICASNIPPRSFRT